MGELNVSERDVATMRVMKTLARRRAGGESLAVRDERGVAPIIVTLPNDFVGEVQKKVRSVGGAANVVLAMPDRFTMWAWDERGADAESAVQVHVDSSMDMLMLWLTRCNGEASFDLVTTELSEGREVEYQF